MITALLIIVLLGVALYFVETYVPMSPPLKLLLRVVVVLLVVLWLLRVFGVADLPSPRL